MEGENDETQASGAQEPQGQGEGQSAALEEVAAATEGSGSGGAAEGADDGAAASAGTGSPAPDYAKQLADKDAEIARLKESAADEKLGYELRLAGAKNVTAAKALLGEHKGDIAALKAAEPWMFESPFEPEAKGATGLPNAGAAVEAGATLKRWRKIAGLDD